MGAWLNDLLMRATALRPKATRRIEMIIAIRELQNDRDELLELVEYLYKNVYMSEYAYAKIKEVLDNHEKRYGE